MAVRFVLTLPKRLISISTSKTTPFRNCFEIRFWNFLLFFGFFPLEGLAYPYQEYWRNPLVQSWFGNRIRYSSYTPSGSGINSNGNNYNNYNNNNNNNFYNAWNTNSAKVGTDSDFGSFVNNLNTNNFVNLNENRNNEKQRPNNVHYLTPEDFERAARTAPVFPNAPDLEAMLLPNFFEGDIRGVATDTGVLHDAGDIFGYPQNSALNLVTYPDKLWPEGRIPYRLEEALTETERVAIAQAFEEYRNKTCIRFVPKRDDDYDFIHVKRNLDNGCSSYVGRAGGNQTVSLEVGKCFTKGIIAHELMHSLGFFHEHSRTDRDKYVIINEENVKPGMLRNFEKYPQKIIDTLGMPYDYGSVMHYHKLAFSKNGKATLEPVEGTASIGQRYQLSEIDAAKVNKLYRCTDTSPHRGGTTIADILTTTAATTTLSQSSSLASRTTNGGAIITASGTPAGSRETTATTQTGSTSATTAQFTSVTPSTTTIINPGAEFRSLLNRGDKDKCKDLNEHCDMWADIGHCKWSEKYMTHYCKKSCRLCFTELPKGPSSSLTEPSNAVCTDKNLFCGYWARIGECETESKFMKIFCRKSCNYCL